MRLLGARFRVLGWIALGILVATGATNLYFRGVGWSLLFNPVFWSTPFGSALGWKLVFVAFVVVATAAHDVLAGRNALAALEREPSSPQGVRARRIASWLGRAVLLASLAILFFATALVRGFL